MPENTPLPLDEKWPLQLDLIRKLISAQIPTGRQGKFSAMAAEEFLGVTPKKWKAWESGQRPSADDLERIGRKLHLTPAWLLFGEGKPFAEKKTAAEPSIDKKNQDSIDCYQGPKESPQPPTPGYEVYAKFPILPHLIEVCSLKGAATDWLPPATLRFKYPVQEITRHWIALQLDDNLLAIRGLPHGCILYCNSHQLPHINEIVYIRRKDKTEGIRLWLGYEDSTCARLGRYVADTSNTGAESVLVKEYLPLENILFLAPVVFVQLRA